MAAAPSLVGLGLSSPTASPQVYNSPSSDSSDGDDDAPLPFPEALPRADFLAPDFQPATYLSALSHRHQTLEDLRSDLRDRSAAISSELLELVNSNYTAFLSLGNELRGGDDKVEDVKVALLGFRRAVEEVKGRVAARKTETQSLNGELRQVQSTIEQGRKMIELSERVTALEERLAVDSTPRADRDDEDWEEDDSDDNEEDHDNGLLATSPAKLQNSARAFSQISTLADSIGRSQPFVVKIEERLTRCRNTILLDLGNALKESKKAGPKGQDRVIQYLGIYRVLDAQAEAVKLLRGGS